MTTFINKEVISQEITFISKTFDFGSIKKNDNGSGTFKIINTGYSPLVISQVKSSCGCLVPIWHRKPIQPSDTAIIGFRYDTKRVGPINKSMTIVSNATNAPRTVVRIKGIVYLNFVELEKDEFSFDLGDMDFNEFKSIDFELISKDSTSKIWLKAGRDSFIEKSEYSDMIKVSKKEISDWRKRITINLTNIYGNIGKKIYRYKIQYNNKKFATISITANFVGYPGDRVFQFIDSQSYVVQKKTYYYRNNGINKIKTEEKRKYDRNPSFKTSEIKYFQNGIIIKVIEKRRYYNNKIYISLYRLEKDKLILIEKKEDEL